MDKLPFVVNTKEKLQQQLLDLEGQMQVRQLGMHEWLLKVLKGEEPWLFAPETGLTLVLARLYALHGGFTEKELESIDLSDCDPDELAQEFVKTVKIGQVRIGRGDDQYFDMNLIEISQGGKNHSVGSVREEPQYADAYVAKHPIGVVILPYFVDTEGNYFINIVARNEAGAINAGPTLAAREQTSLTKLLEGGIIDRTRRWCVGSLRSRIWNH